MYQQGSNKATYLKLNVMKMHIKNLTKRNWNTLMEFNIVDAEGNGFANTTKDFDSLFSVSKTPKYILVKNTVYKVAYYSGCFYPLWDVVSAISNFEPYEYYHVTIKDGVLKVEEKIMGI